MKRDYDRPGGDRFDSRSTLRGMLRLPPQQHSTVIKAIRSHLLVCYGYECAVTPCFPNANNLKFLHVLLAQPRKATVTVTYSLRRRAILSLVRNLPEPYLHPVVVKHPLLTVSQNRPPSPLAPQVVAEPTFISLGLFHFCLTNSSSPGGRSAAVFPANMLCKLRHSVSTVCTGLQPCLSKRSKHIIPLL
jgi:hypothetical protein